MSTHPAMDVHATAIAANLEVLHLMLMDAAQRSAEARELMQRGERNGAIGMALGLDVILDNAKALYIAALALHGIRPS